MGWNLAYGEPIGQWVAQRINGGYHAERSQAIGLVRDERIVAGVIYENFNSAAVFCHIAIEGRLTRQFLGVIFDYPFRLCGVGKIIVPVSSANVKSVRFVMNLGFVEECRIDDGHPDGDLIFFTMKKANCRFLGERYGQR